MLEGYQSNGARHPAGPPVAELVAPLVAEEDRADELAIPGTLGPFFQRLHEVSVDLGADAGDFRCGVCHLASRCASLNNCTTSAVKQNGRSRLRNCAIVASSTGPRGWSGRFTTGGWAVGAGCTGTFGECGPGLVFESGALGQPYPEPR